jgi:hypothetical protein
VAEICRVHTLACMLLLKASKNGLMSTACKAATVQGMGSPLPRLIFFVQMSCSASVDNQDSKCWEEFTIQLQHPADWTVS